MRITWTTASELNTAGFHIWRSETIDGEYMRITEQLIPSEGGATQGSRYIYQDFDIRPGQTYYYKLEEIDNKGNSAFHDNIVPTVGSGAGIYQDTIAEDSENDLSGGCLINTIVK